MRSLLPLSRVALTGALFVLVASYLSAQASVVFVADDKGNVGRFVDGQTSGTALGSLSDSDFSVSQILGIAYDSKTNAVLLFDRDLIFGRQGHTVYSMDATTGVAKVLFTTPSTIYFQGGAVFNNLVYGIDEDTQQILAYSFEGVQQSLSNNTLPEHSHALGVDYDNHQIISYSNAEGPDNTSNVLRRINPDGSEGSIILSNLSSDIDAQDIAYFNGDYLVATYDNSLFFLDGTTGELSLTPYLNSSQLTGMGLTGYVTGVVLEYTAVPEPGTWAMMLVGLTVIAWIGIRRRFS